MVFLLLPLSAVAAPLSVTEVAPGLYVYAGVHEDFSPTNRGAICNLAFIVGSEAVAVIDVGGSPAVGRDLLATIRRTTDRPIRYVILTHSHPDHMLGAEAFFATGAQFIGHARLPAALASRAPSYLANMRTILGPSLGTPALPRADRTVAVGERLWLDLGNRPIELRAWPTAHTDHDLTVFDSMTATLITGDLLFVDRLPVLDGSLNGWLAVIEELAAVPARQAVPGHGPPLVPFPAALQPQRQYLADLRRMVRELVRAGTPLNLAPAAVPAPAGWQLVDPNHGRNVTAAYAELEWE